MPNILNGKITAKEAALLIGVSPNTILIYAKGGKLPCIKRGARFFFSEQDVLNLITPHNNDKEQLA